MKKETRDKKTLEYISTLPEAVQMDKGVVLYEMREKWWTIIQAWLCLDKIKLWYSIESACNAIGKWLDASYMRARIRQSESLQEVIRLAKESISSKALENVIRLQTQAENETVQFNSSKFILENLHEDFKQNKESINKSINIHAFIDATKSKPSDQVGWDMIRFLRWQWD